MKICPYCKSDKINYNLEKGEITCSNCGTVLIQNYIDSGMDWRAFTPEDIKNKSRVGAPTTLTLHDKGLSTIIGWKNIDAFGKAISPKMKAEIKRLRTWNERSKTAETLDRNLSKAMMFLNQISPLLSLTKNLKDNIARYYRAIVKKNSLRGRSIQKMVLGAVYVVLRQNSKITKFKTFEDISNTSFKKIFYYANFIREQLDLKIPPPLPHELIPKMCADLKLSGQIEMESIRFLISLKQEISLIGKRPSGIASAVLYRICLMNNERRTQKEISQCAGTTEATLRNIYHLIFYR